MCSRHLPQKRNKAGKRKRWDLFTNPSGPARKQESRAKLACRSFRGYLFCKFYTSVSNATSLISRKSAAPTRCDRSNMFEQLSTNRCLFFSLPPEPRNAINLALSKSFQDNVTCTCRISWNSKQFLKQ